MDILRRISAVLGDIIVSPVKRVWQNVFAKPVEDEEEISLWLEWPASEEDLQKDEAEYPSSLTTLIPSWTQERGSSDGTNTTSACSTVNYSVCAKPATKPKRKRKPQSGPKSGKNGKRRGRNGK